VFYGRQWLHLTTKTAKIQLETEDVLPNKKTQTDGAKNRTFRSSLRAVKSDIRPTCQHIG